ncbi:uncharacterized protein LOC121872601 isoform X2 [Homarus americanus]|uniref:uncharacterized protein LOC121872601 isoform X2 n=2 Tax=Homarus americanus TaxID=6706 RepID=UPI001C46867B|nr:uncharacterized protein LOC121872601 isoform X2 [Homarus americanus]
MFVLPSVSTLARTAALGGFIVIGSAFYFKSCIQDGIKQSGYYKESLSILRSHRGIAHLMGEPIKDGRVDLADNVNNFCTGKEAQFQVPVKGTKQSGTLYLWASRIEYDRNWNVDRLELGLENDPGRRVLLRDSSQMLVNEENQSGNLSAVLSCLQAKQMENLSCLVAHQLTCIFVFL